MFTLAGFFFPAHITKMEKETTPKPWNDTSLPEFPELDGWLWDDALWQITASIIIFNMQDQKTLYLSKMT